MNLNCLLNSLSECLENFVLSNFNVSMFEKKSALTLTMLNSDTFVFENTVDPDQLASEKPANQDPHCFPLCL